MDVGERVAIGISMAIGVALRTVGAGDGLETGVGLGVVRDGSGVRLDDWEVGGGALGVAVGAESDPVQAVTQSAMRTTAGNLRRIDATARVGELLKSS